MALKKLNRRHLLFIEHYCLTKNGTESAKIAGYGEKCACSQAIRLLKDPLVVEQVDKKCNDMLAVYDLSEQVIKSELGKIANGDRQADATHVRALELLAKIKGMMVDRSVVTHDTQSIVDRVIEAQAKQQSGTDNADSQDADSTVTRIA